MFISVIIPAYNAEATLAESLVSVQAQSLVPLQVVVVDDCSTDATAEIARMLGVGTIRHTVNQGVAAAINTGLRACLGDAVAILDADDLWPANALQMQSDVMTQTGAGAVVGCVQEFVCPSLVHDAAEVLPRPVQPGWLYGSTLVRRTAFERVGPFDPELRTGAWIDWMSRAKGKVTFERNPEVVLGRRLRPGTLSCNPAQRAKDMLKLARAAIQRSRG